MNKRHDAESWLLVIGVIISMAILWFSAQGVI
jgi:hypothetical protein